MPDKDIQISMENAASLLSQRRFEEALNAYHEIVEENPQCGEAWLRLGSLIHQRGNLPGAEACYRSAINIDNNDVNAISGWCSLLPIIKRPGESDELITQLIDNPPMHPEACFNLAILYSALGRHADALDSVDRALKNAPEVGKYTLVRADILARRGDFEEAFDILKPYLEANPPVTGAVLVFSNFSHVVGLREECIELLENVRDLKMTNPDLRTEVIKAIERVRNAHLN